jgi:hypothetical protein
MIVAAVALARKVPGVACDLAVGALFGFSLIGLYFVGYHRSAVPQSFGVAGFLRSAVDFLGTSLCPLPPLASEKIGGMSARDVWGCIAAAILLVGGFMNVVVALRARGEFVRSSGMALAIAGTLILALAIGWGRRQASWSRYAILSAPGLLAVYISTLLPQAFSAGWLLRGILFIAALAAAGPNLIAGRQSMARYHTRFVSFERDLRAGVPPMVLAEQYSRYPNVLDRRQREQDIASGIRLLERSGVPPFRDLRDDPIYRVIDISGTPDSQAGRLKYVLQSPMHVYAVRLSYQYASRSSNDARARFCLNWVAQGPSAKRPMPSYACQLPRDGREDHLLVWIDEPISEFSIAPDEDLSDCRIVNVQCLVR